MTSAGVPSLRLRSQRLTGEPLDRAEEVVRWLGAVQAQDYGRPSGASPSGRGA